MQPKRDGAVSNMRALVTIVAAAVLCTPTSAAAAAADARTADAGRALTGLLMIRCIDAAGDTTTTHAERRYACNPTGPETCAPTVDGTTACAVMSAMPRACRATLHPEWYETRLFTSVDETREFDRQALHYYAEYHGSGQHGSLALLVSTGLPSVKGKVSSASTECGTKEELRDLRHAPVAKPKPKQVWKCTKKNRKTGKRKCHKVKTQKQKPAKTPPVVETDPPPPTPAEVAAKRYAYSIASLVSDCSRSSVTYEQVKRRYDNGDLWSTKCSPLYYSKLKAARDDFNANFPDSATPYPSLLIVTQVENVYLKKTGSTSEIENVNCWLSWGSNTMTKPIPTGCNG